MYNEFFTSSINFLSIFSIVDYLQLTYNLKFMIVNKSDFEKGLIWVSK